MRRELINVGDSSRLCSMNASEVTRRAFYGIYLASLIMRTCVYTRVSVRAPIQIFTSIKFCVLVQIRRNIKLFLVPTKIVTLRYVYGTI